MLNQNFENNLDYRYKEGFGTDNFSDGINLLRDPAHAEILNVEMPLQKWNHFTTWLFKWSDQIDRSVCLSSILTKDYFSYSHVGM